MNNTCPSCGAIYNVAGKDVGRRIKCKKCGTSLTVTDAGLEVDDPNAAAAPVASARPVAAAADFADDDDEDGAPSRKSARNKKPPRAPIDFMKLFADCGGFSTVLFGFGAFLVIVFLFQPIIGNAAVERAQGAVERVDLQWKTKEREMRKDKKAEDDISKAREEFYKKKDKESLDEDVGYERVSNKRSHWMEMYGMMFGFLFLMAGSIGYMTPGQSTVRRILGTIVLGAQVLIIFMVFAAGGGCGGKGNPLAG